MFMFCTTPFALVIFLPSIIIPISLCFIYYIKRKYDYKNKCLEYLKKGDTYKNSKKKINKELRSLELINRNFFKMIKKYFYFLSKWLIISKKP